MKKSLIVGIFVLVFVFSLVVLFGFNGGISGNVVLENKVLENGVLESDSFGVMGDAVAYYEKCDLIDNDLDGEINEGSVCCGDGSCNYGETIEDCAIDCSSDYADKDYDYYLNFFEILFGGSPDIEPQPEGLVQFAIGSKLDNYDSYHYITLKTAQGHEVVSLGYGSQNAYDMNVYMSREEVEALYESRGTRQVHEDVFQRADIKKLCELKPDLCPEGMPKYGVALDANGDVVIGSDGKAISDCTLEEYQQGKTLVMPTTYNSADKSKTRLHWNYNNPLVRQYLVDHAVRLYSNNPDGKIFLDNSLIQKQQYYNYSSKSVIHYIDAGDEIAQIKKYALQYNEIVGGIKEKTGAEIILNGLRDQGEWVAPYYDTIYEKDGFANFDGILIEDRYFYGDDWYYDGGIKDHKISEEGLHSKHPWVTNVQFYLDWKNRLKGKDMKLLLSASSIFGISDVNRINRQAYEVYLWNHLIADTNTFFFINKNYLNPMQDYPVYDYPLGNPLGEAYKVDDTWYREYERGTIVFNTTSGYLDSIKFIENSEIIDPPVDPVIIDPPVDPVIIDPPLDDPVVDPDPAPSKTHHGSSSKSSKKSDEPLDEGNESDVSNSSSGEVGREVVVLQAIKDVMILQGLKDGIFSFETEFASSSGFSSSDGLLFGLLIFIEVIIIAGIVLILMKTDFNRNELSSLWRKFVK